ncbi:MAG: DUF4345 domain-containing protein [Gammaproteobacteria bacterium]|nr:DUF4345 domain-containing protein [Gammaproteobacteria bacterium]
MKAKLKILQIPLLILSGAILILISTSIILSPTDFYGSYNIDLGMNVSLLNELKAPAGLLLAAGLFMISATFIRSRVDTALKLAALIYLSYSASRVVSMLLDGVPASGLITAAALEVLIGLACIAVVSVSKTPVTEVRDV